MNMKKLLVALILSVAFQSATALAQDNIIALSDHSATSGGMVTITSTWTNNNAATGVQFDVIYNTTDFTFNTCTVLAPYNTYVSNCAPVGDVVRFTTFRIPTAEIPSGDLYEITFTVNAGPGNYQIDAGNPSSGTMPVTFDPALITVLGPAFNSSPIAPNAPIAFGSHTAGDMNPVMSTDVDNAMGEMGTNLIGDCSVQGPDAAAFILTGDPVMLNVPQAGPPQTLEVACNSENLMPATYNMASLVCNHNGTSPPGAASPVMYPLSCTILAAPAPNYSSSNPAVGGSFNFGTVLSTDVSPMQIMTITNDGNLDGLDGACTVTADPNGAFSVSDSGVNYGPLAQMASAMRTVTCNTGVIGNHSGTLTCTALAPAANAGNFDYPLNCEVLGIPDYGSTPIPGAPLAPMIGNQGNANPTTSLAIANEGEAGSFLSGNCLLAGGSAPQLSIQGSSAFVNLEVGGPSANITVECDATSLVGSPFNGTLSCTANAPASNPGPHTYAVSCDIGSPDPANYVSTPGPGAMATPTPIDLTPGGPVVEGTDLTNAAQLAINNGADPGDDFLDLMGCSLIGPDGEITANPVTVDNDINVGDPDVVINFSCNTAADGSFSNVYECA
jgi:hypothetical protein